MDEPINGFDYLERLRKENGKKEQSFNDFGELLEKKARQKGVPLSGQFELTPLCNFSCKMCYVHLEPEQLHGKRILPPEIWKDLFHQAWESGMIDATLTGGECLVYSGFDELYLYLRELGCSTCIITNGFLLDEERIRFFQENKPDKIQITLYGWNDDVYERVTGQRAFSVVEKNIRNAVEAGLHIMISITPSSFLGEDVLETVRVAKKLVKNVRINNSLFAPREETGRAKLDLHQDIDQYVRIFRLLNELDGRECHEIDEDKLPAIGGSSHECEECGIRCGGGRSSFTVDWKGTMVLCNRMSMIHSFPLEEGFAAAWKKINREANNWPRVPECEECPYDPICPNCAANMLEFAEPGKQPLGLCKRTKYYVQRGIIHLPECE